MRALLSHDRFWLFAPFFGLLALTLLAYGFWHMATTRISGDLAARGLSWQELTLHGFPARITLDMQAPRYRHGDIVWQTDRASATLMPFNHRHVVFDFFGTHNIRSAAAQLQLSHQGNLMSLVRDARGVLRASFEAKSPNISARRGTVQADMSAAHMTLHMRRASATQTDKATPTGAKGLRWDAALSTKHLRLPASGTNATGRQTIERLDVMANLPARLLQSEPQSGDRLKLERMTVQRGALTIIARGVVRLAASGYVEGRLDVDLVNRRALLDALIEWGFIRAEDRRQVALLIGLASAYGGDTQDRLSLPLSFKERRVFLGPIDIAAAPRWQAAP